LTFKRSGSGYRISPGGQPARAWQTVCEEPISPSFLHVHHEFLRDFHSIHFVDGFLVHEVRGWSVLECQAVCVGADGPWVHHGWSVVEGAVLVFRVLIRTVRRKPADGSPWLRGRFAVVTRTVRLGFHKAAKSFASCVSLSLCDHLGFVPRVGRSVVTTRPWQTHVGIRGCEFGS
jgi:hypothetical protein